MCLHLWAEIKGVMDGDQERMRVVFIINTIEIEIKIKITNHMSMSHHMMAGVMMIDILLIARETTTIMSPDTTTRKAIIISLVDMNMDVAMDTAVQEIMVAETGMVWFMRIEIGGLVEGVVGLSGVGLHLVVLVNLVVGLLDGILIVGERVEVL